MYEGYRYLTGGPVEFGLASRGNNGVLQPSVQSSREGNAYVSPMDQQCQANYLVLLTDGLPLGDTDADARIEKLIGTGCNGSCLDELTAWMATTDHDPALDGDQFIDTYAIGFYADDPLLNDAATATRPDGSNGYFTAGDLLELSGALREVFEDIEENNTTFQSPALAIDGFNRLVNSNDLYFSMFIPSGAPYWAGNIKKYRLASLDGAMRIVDADAEPAVKLDGTFRDGARSFWSDIEDGADVRLGGVRNRMGANRRIYTDTARAGRDVDLWAPENRFIETNELITAAMLNVDEAGRDALMRFLRGVDTNGNEMPLFGDPLHSNPVLVNFADSDGGTSLKMFVATNDGYLHALDMDPETDATPMEEFAFIPAELLSRLWRLADNEPNNPSYKGYGLDGPIRTWIQNDDGDQVVESGETLYVFVGMRRGGRNYYALRIPGDAPTRPSLAWTVRGGVEAFAELGQTWSAPTVARVRDGDGERTVLIVGGGYDAISQDQIGSTRPDSMGRAVFLIDAQTGERLWWAGPADATGGTPDLMLLDMTNSIPSTVAAVDSGGDGLVDRIYVGDMGGRVWRLDIPDLARPASGGVLANLATGAPRDNLRFHYRPSISRVADPRYGSFISVAIGSGHRATPLDASVDDRFFMLRDPYLFAPPVDAEGNVQYPMPINELDLVDITNQTSPSADALNAARGWVLRLAESGEKSLAVPLTADNRVFFSTFVPGAGFDATCNLAGVLGGGRFYEVDLLTGAPVIPGERVEDVPPAPEERHQDLGLGGIPPSPRLVFTECDGDCLVKDSDRAPPGDIDADDPFGGGSGCENPFSEVTLVLGTQTVNPNICNSPVRTYWRRNRR